MACVRDFNCKKCGKLVNEVADYGEVCRKCRIAEIITPNRKPNENLILVAWASGAFVLLFSIYSFLVYYFFNWVIVEVFNMKPITLWQSFGLLALSEILFKTVSNNYNYKK